MYIWPVTQEQHEPAARRVEALTSSKGRQTVTTGQGMPCKYTPIYPLHVWQEGRWNLLHCLGHVHPSCSLQHPLKLPSRSLRVEIKGYVCPLPAGDQCRDWCSWRKQRSGPSADTFPVSQVSRWQIRGASCTDVN